MDFLKIVIHFYFKFKQIYFQDENDLKADLIQKINVQNHFQLLWP